MKDSQYCGLMSMLWFVALMACNAPAGASERVKLVFAVMALVCLAFSIMYGYMARKFRKLEEDRL